MEANAQVGIDISVDYRNLWRAGTLEALTVHDNLCRDVVLLRLFPSIRTETVRAWSPPLSLPRCATSLPHLSVEWCSSAMAPATCQVTGKNIFIMEQEIQDVFFWFFMFWFKICF